MARAVEQCELFIPLASPRLTTPFSSRRNPLKCLGPCIEDLT